VSILTVVGMEAANEEAVRPNTPKLAARAAERLTAKTKESRQNKLPKVGLS
jgi:hypothetical protein